MSVPEEPRATEGYAEKMLAKAEARRDSTDLTTPHGAYWRGWCEGFYACRAGDATDARAARRTEQENRDG